MNKRCFIQHRRWSKSKKVNPGITKNYVWKFNFSRISPRIYNNKWPQEGVFWIGGPAARAGWRLLQFLHRIGRFFFHGVRVNWKQKHLSDWFVFEITFLLWRWRHKIQNTHAINFQTRASLDWSEIFAAVVKWRRRKKAQGKKNSNSFQSLFFPRPKL